MLIPDKNCYYECTTEATPEQIELADSWIKEHAPNCSLDFLYLRSEYISLKFKLILYFSNTMWYVESIRSDWNGYPIYEPLGKLDFIPFLLKIKEVHNTI